MSSTVINFNKSLHPDDYNDSLIEIYGDIFDNLRTSVPSSIQHEHRRWEHCMAMAAIEKFVPFMGEKYERGRTDILEVGSGGSLFAPMCSLVGYNITVVDPSDSVKIAIEQNPDINVEQIDYIKYDALTKYDTVVCLSVLEHIEDDIQFFNKLLQDAKFMVFLTVDFSVDGRTFSKDHLRTYSPTALYNLYLMAHEQGFSMPDNPEWFISNENHVYDYNFASLCLVRDEKIQS